MAPRADQKILRIGIIQGGKIVEERLVRGREDVTLGSSPKNTFVIPASTLPKTFTLFENKGGRYHLAFSESMDGKVSVGNGMVDFSSLKSQNLAKKKGSVFQYALPETARGKVSLGDVTLLFQFVAPPPEQPRPVLPKEFRNGWVKSIDKAFTAILVISLVWHVSSLYFLSGVPIPEGRSLDQIPDRFAKLIVPERPETPPPELPSKDDLPREEDRKEIKEEPEQKERPERTEEEIQRAAQSKEVQDAVRDQGILKVIGAKGEGGAFADLLAKGGKAQNLDDALARAGGVKTARDGDDIRGLAGGGDDRRADIGDLATGGAGEVDRGERKATQVRGRIQSGAIEADTTTVDAEQLARFIRANQQAIQNCYEAELRRNPRLQGRLLIAIEIGTNSRVSRVDVIEDSVGSAAVANCVRTRIRGWRFPVRPPEPTTVNVPFIFAPSG
jgi:hypothetical protein